MPEPGSAQRRVTLVVGAEPAANATVAATLAALGLGTLPGGWVADLHAELLGRVPVEVADARPSAWFETGKIAANGITRARLTEWLGPRFTDAEGQPRPELVVHDPGLVWLLGLWRAAALRCDAETAHVVVLQPAPQAATDVPGVAGWLNAVLHAERGTRGLPRAFVRYDDVAADWTVPFVGVGVALGLRAVQEATANQIRQGHAAVAAGAPPSPRTWADTPVPAALQALADDTWRALAALAEPGRDTLEAHARLDDLRTAYQAMYDDAEALTRSSLRAARAEGRAEAPVSVRPGSSSPIRRVLGRARGLRG